MVQEAGMNYILHFFYYVPEHISFADTLLLAESTSTLNSLKQGQ